jgi:hypothetical protein
MQMKPLMNTALPGGTSLAVNAAERGGTPEAQGSWPTAPRQKPWLCGHS